MLACTSPGRLARDLRHPAYVDADRRQDSSRAHSEGEPLVERSALSEFARALHVDYSVWKSALRHGVRLRRAQIAHSHLRSEDCFRSSRATFGSRLLSGTDVHTALARH